MIIFSNFRKEEIDEQVKLRCDIKMTGGNQYLPANELWLSVEKKFGYLLNENICDGYLVAAMAFGMYYAQNVKVCGYVSKKLYDNLMNYVQGIFLNHDPGLKKVEIVVEGFLSDDFFEEDRTIIGSFCSFGVDGLSTIYDKWLLEDDIDNKVNMLFSFNCGINGGWEDKNTPKLFADRTQMYQKGLEELGIPLAVVDTNAHQFFPQMYVYATACYLGRYFCVLNLQGGVKKCYVPNGFSYSEIMQFGNIPFRTISRGKLDIGLSYEEPFLLPLLNTEYLELVLDGAQLQRTQKTERLTNWEFSHRYLNVCQPGRQLEGDFSKNCSKCPKCIYTMFCLDTLGKLDEYSDVFDVKNYYANKFLYQAQMIEEQNDNLLTYDALRFAEKKGIQLLSDNDVRKLSFYKWRFGDVDSYMPLISEIFMKYSARRKILWGTGWIGSIILAALDVLNLKVDAVVDSDIEKQGDVYFEYTIQNYKEIQKENDIILVCGTGICSDVEKIVDKTCRCIDIVKMKENYLMCFPKLEVK